jgi:hypothetical protein
VTKKGFSSNALEEAFASLEEEQSEDELQDEEEAEVPEEATKAAES